MKITIRLKWLSAVMMTLCLSGLSSQSVIRTMKRVPDTDQNLSYTNTYGEDSDYKINNPFYVDNGDGTITDTVTGLMWQKTDGGEMTYDSAILYVKRLDLAGHQDWRLPNVHESFSILNLDALSPALNKAVFTNTGAEYWWSSDLSIATADKAWVTNSGGGQGAHLKSESLSAGGTRKIHARAVRDVTAPTTLPERYKLINDSVVVDFLTGLMWERFPYQDSLSWEDALIRAEKLNVGGYGDWRLPNIKEIESIQDVKGNAPPVNKSFFPKVLAKKYWSSTSQYNRGVNAWYIDFQSVGLTTYTAKNSRAAYALCVRSAEDRLLASYDIENDKVAAFVYPNPADGFLHFRFKGLREGNYQLLLTNSGGIMVLKKEIWISEGEVNLDLNTESQPQGIYHYALQSAWGTVCSDKVVIIHH